MLDSHTNTRLVLRRTLTGLFILLLLPLGIGFVNPASAYSPLYRDGWLYHGYFLDLPGHLKAFGDLYYSSRLSMTLPGWLVYRAFPAGLANHVLHLGVYLLGTWALFLQVRQTVSERAALLAALLMGGHFLFVQAASSDYCDGFAIGYFLLAGWLAAAAARSPSPRIWWLLAGAAGAALVVTNLMLGLLVVPLFGTHVLLVRAEKPGALVRSLLWLAAGACLLGLGLAAFSKFAGGPFAFFLSTLRFAAGFQMKGPNPFKEPVGEWLPHGVWLVLPAAAALGALLWLASGRGRTRAAYPPVAVWYQVQLLGTFAVLAAMECSAHHNLLQVWLYAVPFLVPLTFLALAAQWADTLDGLSPRVYGLLAGSALLLPVCLAAVPAGPLPAPVLAVPAGLAAAAVLLPRLRAGLAGVLVAVALLAAADHGLRQRFEMSRSLGPNVAADLRIERDGEFAGRRAEVFSSVHEAMRTIRRWDPEYAACFWFDIDEPLGLVFDNVACLHCWGHRLVNTSFPAPEPARRGVRPGMRLVVVSADPDLVGRARRAVQPAGLRLEVLREGTVGRGSVRFTAYLLETRREEVLGRSSGRDGGS